MIADATTSDGYASDVGKPVSEGLCDDRLTLAGLLFESSVGLGALLERRLDEAGLSRQWFEVLIRLARSPEHRLRMSELAAQTTLTASGLTRVIDRMEDTGLVTRQACPDDRRSLYAAITKEGLKRVRSSLPGHLEELQDNLVGVFSPSERATLEQLLRKLRDHVNPCATAGT